MKLKGILEEIIFQNDENYYTIGILSHDDVYSTIVGYGYGLKIGDAIELDGDYIIHDVYGEQFKFSTFIMIMPNTRENIIKFLSSGSIKGIGPSTAEKILWI